MAEYSVRQMKSRTLVLCFDGTSNEYDADNTNVVKLFSLLKKDDFNEQLCYYQAGIGTWYKTGVVSPAFQWAAKVLDLAFAWYLDEHVMDGYRFLMQNYCVGDKICLFGFSRGSYTARALAGMLYKVGLLPKDNDEQIPFGYKLYKRTDKASIELCAGFKQTYCQTVKVEFMGVWDTVSSVGIVAGRTLPFTNSNDAIKTFRHALSLDEHRAKFRANYYHRPAPNEEAVKHDPEQGSPIIGLGATSIDSSNSGDKPKGKGYRRYSLRRTGKSIMPAIITQTGDPEDVLEVWFSGCHSDVGGGAVSNQTSSCLANITLRWMVCQIMQSDCGIQFNVDALELAQISIVDIKTGPEPTPDEADSLKPIHDPLKESKLWWILEIIPMSYNWQDAEGVWHRDFGCHMGKGRYIADTQPKFHTSVKHRIDSVPGYSPKAKWKTGTEVYVD